MKVFSRELIEKAKREVDVPQSRPATVLTYNVEDVDWGRQVCTVHVDGDAPDVAISAVSLLPVALATNDRVMVTFTPPHGVFVTGFAGRVELPASRVNWIVPFTHDGALTESRSERYYPGEFGATCYYVIASLQTAASVGETTVNLLVRNCVAYGITFPPGVNSIAVEVDIGCSATDWIATGIDTVGDNAEQLTVQWFLRPGGTTDPYICAGGEE